MRSAGPGALAACLLLSAAPAGAQGVAVRLGGVHARYADSLSGSAASLALQAVLERGSLRASADLMHARFSSDNGYSTQGTVGLTAMTGLGSTAALGVRALASASNLSGGTSAWTAAGETFGAVLLDGWLVSGALSGGAVRDIAGATRPLAGAALGVRLSPGALAVETRVAGTLSRGTRFADFTVGVLYDRGALRVGGTAGARAGDLGGDPLLQLQAELRVHPLVAFEMAGGSYPGDLTGYTSGRFFNAGIRVALARERPAPGRFGVAVELLPRDRGARVTFDVPDADTVAIVGEWNQWQPAPLRRVARGRFQAVLPLAPGAYRFSLVVGGRWVVPPGVPKLPDDFGGEVGVLVI